MADADAIPPAVPVDAYFVGDVRRHVVTLLKDSGFTVPKDIDASRACQLYFNARKRRIEPRARRVHVSRELNVRNLSLADRHGVGAARRTSEAGGNLNPFLSTRIDDLEYDDLLLNDWGIHHLHLGTWQRKMRRGFVGRTRTLLCARVEANDAYFIDVIEHKPSSKFSDEQLIKILHQNWPTLLDRYRLAGVTPVRDKYDAEVREKFRHVGVSLSVQVDGNVYAPPGGGYMTSGFSMECLMWSDRLLSSAHHLEKQCRENPSLVVRKVRAETGRDLAQLALAYRCDDDGWYVVETQTGVELWRGTP